MFNGYYNSSVAWYDFTAQGYDPTNVKVLDLSGNDRHLTLGDGSTSSTYPVKELHSKGYNIERSSSQRLLYNGNTGISGTEPWTLFSVFRPEGSTGNYQGFISIGNTAVSGQTAYIGLTSPLECVGGYYGLNIISGVTVQVGELCFMVGTYDGTYYSNWVNGRFINKSTITSPALVDGAIYVGNIVPSYYYDGIIYETGVFDYELSTIQIYDLYLKFKRKFNNV